MIGRIVKPAVLEAKAAEGSVRRAPLLAASDDLLAVIDEQIAALPAMGGSR